MSLLKYLSRLVHLRHSVSVGLPIFRNGTIWRRTFFWIMYSGYFDHCQWQVFPRHICKSKFGVSRVRWVRTRQVGDAEDSDSFNTCFWYVCYFVLVLHVDLRLQKKKSKRGKLLFFFSVLRTILIICPDAQLPRFNPTDRRKWFYLTLFFHV